MDKIGNQRKTYGSIAAISAAVVASAFIGAAFLMGAIPSQSLAQQSEIGYTGNDLPILSRNEITKTFLIGYEMVGPSEKMNKVGIDDLPWMNDVIQYGEAIVSVDEGKKFLESSGGIWDYAITMKDGTTVYYNINIYQFDMAPDTPYVKAYWHYSMPEGKESLPSDVKDNPSLTNAIKFSSTWIPVESSADARNVEQLLGQNTKYIAVQNEEGATEFYELRYISASQERVS